ncbi:hypothetical protein HGR_06861 [Hylemonella gracilis ATCC 19624]|uniref:Uncharacterized protein n=1 Tax=Hylemonella gracilis ATCC 19624 TaxID=887062 RepID=F3KSE3_9BURK|nr:hypothetical protein HGR_06861 [Hylemonella gracilis ATCC 19624]
MHHYIGPGGQYFMFNGFAFAQLGTQRHDLVPRSLGMAGEVPSREAAGTGEQDFHGSLPYAFLAISE